MAKFKFELESLLRIREIEEERTKRQFFLALKSVRQKEGALMQITQLREHIKEQCRGPAEGTMPIGVEEMLRKRRFINVLYQQILAKTEEVVRQRKIFEEAKAVFRQARMKKRVVEKIKERRLHQFQEEEARREVRELDEISEVYYQNGLRGERP